MKEGSMSRSVSRREMLQGLVSAGIAVEVASWPLPALSQGEQVIPFTDFPADFDPAPSPGVRRFDTRTLTDFITPDDRFFNVQHYGQPQLEAAAFVLRITGLVNRPMAVSLADLKKRLRVEETVGFECSGNNNTRGNPLVGNARWAGVSLASLLRECGVARHAREVVFFGADTGTEEVSHGGAVQKVEQHFARSLSIDEAMRPEVMLAYDMNGRPLSVGYGAPLRLIVPGWYGVANVKWLDRIHLQATRFMGRFMARDYVTLRGEEIGGNLTWNETSVSRMRLKSMVARVTRAGNRYRSTGFALNDGTPLKVVEVRLDDRPWAPATLRAENTRYSWKLFTYQWEGATPGEHTIVSRAIDVLGNTQPDLEDPMKKTRWENHALYVRKIMVP